MVETFLAAAAQPENAGYNLSVLSNQSLFLVASQGVLLVMNVIGLIINPENEILKTAIINQWFSWLKPAYVTERSTMK